MRPTQLVLHKATSAPAPATQPKRSDGIRNVWLIEKGTPTRTVCIMALVGSTLSQPRPAVPYRSTLSAGNQPRRARAVPKYLTSSARDSKRDPCAIASDAALEPLIVVPLKSSS